MKKEQNKKTNIFLVIFLWILAVIAVLAVCAFSVTGFILSPVSGEENVIIEKVKVSEGSTMRKVSNELYEKGLIKSSGALYFAARFSIFNSKGENFSLKSGVYTVKSSMSLKEIYNLLQSGEQEYISVSIPEGLTMKKIARLLEENSVCSAEDFLEACCSMELLNEYSVPAENLEGFLFPDTYFFTPNMEGEAVVRLLCNTFFKRLESLDLDLSAFTAKELYEKVTLASIVEREYRVESEAPLIASVFTNRINQGIGLYSCATIEYIITEIQGRPHPDRITYDDLKINSPYNTYKWAGLTPGPISNPGLIALKAAFFPANTNYYFFVLTDPAKGSHTFSTNFDQHKAAENLNYVSKKAY